MFTWDLKNVIGSKMHNAIFFLKSAIPFLSKKIYIHILYTCRNVVHINSTSWFESPKPVTKNSCFLLVGRKFLQNINYFTLLNTKSEVPQFKQKSQRSRLFVSFSSLLLIGGRAALNSPAQLYRLGKYVCYLSLSLVANTILETTMFNRQN